MSFISRRLRNAAVGTTCARCSTPDGQVDRGRAAAERPRDCTVLRRAGFRPNRHQSKVGERGDGTTIAISSAMRTQLSALGACPVEQADRACARMDRPVGRIVSDRRERRGQLAHQSVRTTSCQIMEGAAFAAASFFNTRRTEEREK